MQRFPASIRVPVAVAAMVLATGTGTVLAAPAPQPPALTEVGVAAMSRYATALTNLQAGIGPALPAIDGARTLELQAARKAVSEAKARLTVAQAPLEKIKQAEGLVGHAKGKWIGGAERNIAAAEAKLKLAATEPGREAAQKELAAAQADLAAGQKALVERQAALDAAKAGEAGSVQASEAAKAALTEAEARELAAARAVLAELDPFLGSDRLDATLVKGTVLAQATPRGLAEFAQQGAGQAALVEKLLSDTALMAAMLEAGGAKAGRWGQAMQIYTGILEASPRAREGVLRRLAVGTSVEHAVPIGQRNAVTQTNAPTVVDPVKRYLHYEKAYLDGELDPAFPTLSAWEYRMVVNSYAPDPILAWGREMLRNYRPDHILNADYGWRYSGVVRTDVAYRHSQEYQDTDTLHFFQNILKNGGICGRRAFFGRYICKSFGLPTWGVAQHAHAALGRWTPSGWVVNLGAGWEASWGPPEETEPGRKGMDFLLEAQARKQPLAYRKVLRAQWVGDILGEPRYDSAKEGSGGFWSTAALFGRKAIVANAKAATPEALGAELGEANESTATKAAAVARAAVTDEDRRIVAGPDGAITVPAAACGGSNQLVRSFLGGQQAIWAGPLTCRVEVSRAGRYALTARVVTVHGEARSEVTVNGAGAPVAMAIPFTVGAWQRTAPVELALVGGTNTIALAGPSSNLALRELVLTPVP